MLVVDYLESHPLAFLVTIIIAGLLVGSFLNVVIYRYPIMLFREWGEMAKDVLTEQGYRISGSPNDERLNESKFNLVAPRSRCQSCRHLIRWWENIPIMSFLLQRGQCTQCKASIGLRYPLVELITALAFAWVAYRFGYSPTTFVYCAFSALLIVHIFIDIDHKILPDPINYILLWLGLVAAQLGLTIPLNDALLGALFGYLSLWSFYWLFKLLTKKEGMGYGDFKLLGAIGAFVGYQQLLLVIILSAGVGALLGILSLALKKADRSTQIPFGPYLAIAGWVTVFWGEPIVNHYMQASGF